LNFLTSAEGSESLTRILLYHVFYGAFHLFALYDGLVVGTFEAGIATARVIAHGLLANNGVVYKIDTVLDPFAVIEPSNSSHYSGLHCLLPSLDCPLGSL
jgi:hypothetical protein